ncbi:MAG: hypothetical protein FJ291_09000 [Planctomycetes bacterium]|nr:hypothetical protein [Planctomycetota bacterium]
MSWPMRAVCLGLVAMLASALPGCALWCDDSVVFFDSLFGYGPPPAPVVVAPPPVLAPYPPPAYVPYPAPVAYYDPWWPPVFFGFHWSVWDHHHHHRPPHWYHRPPPPRPRR